MRTIVRMEYLRRVDQSALAAAKSDERFSEWLLDQDSGSTQCSINYIRTPGGSGSPAGMHTHVVDQIFYILNGTMSLEIEGTRYQAGPGTLVVFPAGVPHRNWNEGTEATVHLAFNVPMPDPNVPFAVTVG
jgi:mannose-6-phosphate isomerase-like protein (cupin superfamily)